MLEILNSLESITSGFTVFEKDQVLTHSQLNSITSYFEDQTRLTRVKLLGVGICCGLHASLVANEVTVTKGAGVTTDGDLLFLSQDTTFDQFKAYDESRPKYDPFYSTGPMLKVYELISKGETDTVAKNLNQFSAETGDNLNDMVVLMLAESYLKDSDLCSGTDCDNLGQDRICHFKVLLVNQDSISSLNTSPDTPQQAFMAIEPLVAHRPTLPAALKSYTELAKVYRASCERIHKTLVSHLPKMFAACGTFLESVFSADPSDGWIGKLTNIKSHYQSATSGIQYYHDFLKDLVDTCNELRESLFGDNTWCCPETDVFPKHLLLGSLAGAADSDHNRTWRYPSPMVSQTTGQLGHVRFLAQKLNLLITTFRIPSSSEGEVRITPSFLEDTPLEKRAIPYYYKPDSSRPIHRQWSYALHQRRMDSYNYSYHAGDFGATGGAAAPLKSQIGKFSFFRVEGHLGKGVQGVVKQLENEIAKHNLPFSVKAVLLGSNSSQLAVKPDFRYTDLHRFHYVLRQDLVHQLNEVKQFSGKFHAYVKSAVDTGVISNDTQDTGDITPLEIATQKHNVVARKSGDAQVALRQGYSKYKVDASWKSNIKATLESAAQFKYNLGKFVKTEFATPFDSLISATITSWLEWLDQLISQKEQHEDESLLFSNFSEDHPAIEHFAGVIRGGTLVLVYDTSSKIVADFMIPYTCCEFEEPEPEQPELSKPEVTPPWILDNGIKVLKPIEHIVADKVSLFGNELEKTWQPKFDTQSAYFSVFKEAVDLGNSAPRSTARRGPVRPSSSGDELLSNHLARAKLTVEQISMLKKLHSEVSGNERRAVTRKRKAAEVVLAEIILEGFSYIASSVPDVSPGSPGHTAISQLGSAIKVIDLEHEEAQKSLQVGLKKILEKLESAAAPNTELIALIHGFRGP